jgi:preprotein translocase subunit SecA
MNFLLRWIFGTKNSRELKKLRPYVEAVNRLGPSYSALSNDELKSKTAEFKTRLENMLKDGLSEDEALDELLPEAFATVREAATRTLGLRPYDVQVMGAVVLHQGKIAEMKTGEGKTLVATMPLYLNALVGKGCHLVTVNDYLARRDAEWMGKIYRFLGMSVGVITSTSTNEERKRAYSADITYGTNNEFGFDYLRDNMKYSLEEYVQRDLYYAIIDEVDSILIDEARTPLIISGPTEEHPERYRVMDRVVRKILAEEKKLGTDPTQNPKEGKNPGRYYQVDLEHRTVTLTEEGVALAEELLGVDNLYSPDEIENLHLLHQSLRAHTLFHRDVDYVVKDGKVIIVDEFTGRLMPGRRWSDGLHQAIEAKEGVPIETENQTLATITFQNYFKMYRKLAGMTGTAETEAEEFWKIYKLDVVVIPTHRPVIRIDEPDLVFKREAVKFRAIAEKVKEIHEKGAPVLVGTTSVEKSERLEKALIRLGIPKKKIQVLNAKHHEREAEIVAQAGRSGAITIATNMAGRGTDIVLGGNPEYIAWKLLIERGFSREDLFADQFIQAVLRDREEEVKRMIEEDSRLDWDLVKLIREERDRCREDQKKVIALGGLHIIGTERHESRRVDNQLRGRAGRQGDPGWTQFYLSLEDELIRIFGGNRILKLMERFGMGEEDVIEHPWITRAIENAQKRVEARNFEIRKNLLEYDDVLNQQRTLVYSERRKILEGKELKEMYQLICQNLTDDLLNRYVPPRSSPDEWGRTGLEQELKDLGLSLSFSDEEWEDLDEEILAEKLERSLIHLYEEKEQRYGEEAVKEILKIIALQTLDQLWKDHLLAMDHLREGIGLRGYGQKDPKREYQKEGFQYFQEMLELFRRDVIRKFSRVEILPRSEEELSQLYERLSRNRRGRFQFIHSDTPLSSRTTSPSLAVSSPAATPLSPLPQEFRHVGRNDPCPCGSGKKFKKCHGRNL